MTVKWNTSTQPYNWFTFRGCFQRRKNEIYLLCLNMSVDIERSVLSEKKNNKNNLRQIPICTYINTHTPSSLPSVAMVYYYMCVLFVVLCCMNCFEYKLANKWKPHYGFEFNVCVFGRSCTMIHKTIMCTNLCTRFMKWNEMKKK